MKTVWNDKPVLDKWMKLKHSDSSYIIMPKKLEDNYFKYNYTKSNGYMIAKDEFGNPRNWWVIYKATICPFTNKLERTEKKFGRVQTLKHAKSIVKEWVA